MCNRPIERPETSYPNVPIYTEVVHDFHPHHHAYSITNIESQLAGNEPLDSETCSFSRDVAAYPHQPPPRAEGQRD